ncbi:hypothetical protein [uncultured Desulfosarcina sp.]|uniref:capsular polysaccharide export protein, LipB/KpsS family n=1 Tax=uncultured Desulfosarcina sp. TaxID=218289 RepID=UPI0029C72BC4|nr:hypothetical protein [uncultured Desulfosarcina sp.]
MNLFFIECSLPFWIDVADKLMRNNDCRIIYWTGASRLEILIRRHFPDIIFHQNAKAVRNIAPEKLESLALPSLGNGLLDCFAKCESTVLKMMDRMARVNEFSYQERIYHYHSLLKYWLAICEKFKPDLVIWPTSPHLVYDYVLYEVCRYFNIKTIMFEKTAFPGYLLPLKRFDQRQEIFCEFSKKTKYKDTSGSFHLSNEIKSRIEEIRGEYINGMPFHVKYKIKNKNKSIYRKLYSTIKRGVPQNLYQKYSNQEMSDIKISRLRYCYELIKSENQRSKLRKYYIQKTNNPDLGRPFIFVALQCQPERSTSPDGGAFAHQYLMVEMLSQTTPESWQIYVKEHISQFKGYQRAECARTKDFYNALLKIPKVKLLPLTLSSFELIDAAKAVATVSGTAGFESIVRGTPALIFGQAWYNHCEGTFQIENAEDCSKYISMINDGYKVDENKIKIFLTAFENISTKGFIDNIYSNAVSLRKKENANSIYETIINMAHI